MPRVKNEISTLDRFLTMKHFLRILALVLPWAATALASPLQNQQVAADAKWLVHVDVDKLRSTTVGAYVIKQVLQTKLESLKSQFDLDVDLNKISSLTAYGNGYQTKPDFNGVVLINTDLDLQKALDAAIEKISQGSSNTPAAIQKTQEGKVTTYSMKDNLVASFQPGKPVIVGKSLDSVQKARDVLSGASANLASTKTFSEFPASQKAYFFLAAADISKLTGEFSGRPGEDDAANPKAKILKLAEGGRVVLGENADQLFLEVSLKARTAELVTQMQQVIQGMIALASLSQPDNQDLQQLAQSAKVSTDGNIVSLKLGYPADKALVMLNSHLEGQKRAEGHGKKHRSKIKAEPKEPSETDEK